MDPHREVLLVLRADLEPEDFIEEVGIAEIALGRLLEERGELQADAVQPEPLAVGAEALRAAVLAHFGQVPTTSDVGTAVGTIDNAAGIEDSDGAVSR